MRDNGKILDYSFLCWYCKREEGSQFKEMKPEPRLEMLRHRLLSYCHYNKERYSKWRGEEKEQGYGLTINQSQFEFAIRLNHSSRLLWACCWGIPIALSGFKMGSPSFKARLIWMSASVTTCRSGRAITSMNPTCDRSTIGFSLSM